MDSKNYFLIYAKSMTEAESFKLSLNSQQFSHAFDQEFE